MSDSDNAETQDWRDRSAALMALAAEDPEAARLFALFLIVLDTADDAV